MKKSIRKLISILISLGGTLFSTYISGYWLLIRPVQNLYNAYVAHSISAPLILNSVIRIFFAATVFGGMWCIFDILAGFFRDEEEDG